MFPVPVLLASQQNVTGLFNLDQQKTLFFMSSLVAMGHYRVLGPGSTISHYSYWNYIKHDSEYNINYAKFSHNAFLKERLLLTRGFTLIEVSTNV